MLPEPAAPFKLAVTVLGWTLRENGSMLTEGLPADLVAQLPKLGWEFTDRRAGSASEGLTVYVPADSPEHEIIAAIQAKLLQLAIAA